PARREEHRHLARLRDLDDALAEARMIDALADVEPLARAIRARRLGEICRDRGLLEALDRWLGRGRGRARGLLAEHRRLADFFRRAVRRLVTVITAALLALH